MRPDEFASPRLYAPSATTVLHNFIAAVQQSPRLAYIATSAAAPHAVVSLAVAATPVIVSNELPPPPPPRRVIDAAIRRLVTRAPPQPPGTLSRLLYGSRLPAAAQQQQLSPAQHLAHWRDSSAHALSVLLSEGAAVNQAAAPLAVVLVPDDVCTVQTAPFTCCESQASYCANCSYLDRLTWTAVNGTGDLADYYSGDFTDRFWSCSQRAAATLNYARFDTDSRCAGIYCSVPECTTDRECVESHAAPDLPGLVAYSCSPLLRRCVYEVQPDNAFACPDGALSQHPCVSRDSDNVNMLAVGRCLRSPPTDETAQLVCDFTVAAAINLDTCACPDTFLTPDKSVPLLWNRLLNVPWARILNFTRFAERIGPADNSTCRELAAENPFAGRIQALASGGGGGDEFNAILWLRDALDTALAGISPLAGTRLLAWLEDAMGGLATFAACSGDVFVNFYAQYIACDFAAGHYCPLAADSPDDGSCCSDRCELRTQGTTLFDGLVAAPVFVFAPAVVAGYLPVVGGVAFYLLALVFTYVYLGVAQMIAYGGGLFCYLPGPLLLTLPLIAAVLRCFRGCCTGCGRFAKAPARCCNTCWSRIAVALAVFAPLAGLSVCIGTELYTYSRELIPPCYPAPVALINRTALHSTGECSVLDAPFAPPLPDVLNCAEPGVLLHTQFRDGVDNVLYYTELLQPGVNDQLARAAERVTGLSWLAQRARLHSTEAHEADEPRTAACAAQTWFNVLWGALFVLVYVAAALAFQLLATVLLLALIPIFAWLFYSLYRSATQTANAGALAEKYSRRRRRRNNDQPPPPSGNYSQQYGDLPVGTTDTDLSLLKARAEAATQLRQRRGGGGGGQR